MQDITLLHFSALENFLYVQSAPVVQISNTSTNPLTKSLAFLHECSVDSTNNLINLGKDLSKWVVQGLEGNFDENQSKVKWSSIIFSWIPPTERKTDLLSFRFEFHFQDGTIQHIQSKFVYRIERDVLKPEDQEKLEKGLRIFAKNYGWRSAQKRSYRINPCGIQTQKFKNLLKH
mmetsp:Transcript_25257/g.35387  ORF Transcript_25257/g.35387 Transcript_25257/m.35387 type:complete len:175 (-) Transcript_25257:70-594(-)